MPYQVAATTGQASVKGVVGALYGAQLPAKLVYFLNHALQLVVECAGTLSDVLGVAILFFYLPKIVDDSQRHHQSGWTDEHDAFVKGLNEQSGVQFHSQGESGLNGNEQKDEIQRP